MPLRRGRGKAVPQPDPLTACLDANGTYICTAFNPRCYIIQKVTPTPTFASELNPDAPEFNISSTFNEESDIEGCAQRNESINIQGDNEMNRAVYMNGDVGKLPSGAVYATIPDSGASGGAMSDFVTINGVAEGTEALSPLTPTAPPENSMSLAELKHQLSQQLEYYFSRENLANDTYLLSQMDDDQYVPIWTVANFNQVKRLTKDINLITEVLRESPNVQVDKEGAKVRPNHKRCIVILREIPDNTPLEEVKKLFAGENCPKFISCEFAHNNSWYVTFESDDDAQRAYRYLREEVKQFQNKPIMARIKAKPMNRMAMPTIHSFKNGFTSTPAAQAATTSVFDPATYPPGQQRFIFANGTPPYGNQVHVYPQQFQQPYYTSVVQAWPAAGTPFYDISTVFQVNGLAPQPNFKSQPYRSSNARPRKQTRISNSQSESSAAQPATQNSSRQIGPVPPSVSPQGISKPNVTSNVRSPLMPDSARSLPHQVVIDGQEAHSSNNISVGMASVIRTEVLEDATLHYRPVLIGAVHASKEPLPPRHRRKRKEEENGTNHILSAQSQSREQAATRGAQFDLEDSAFPPLPETFKTGQVAVVNAEIGQQQLLQHQTSNENVVQNHWGDNRLADVVKGTAKSKASTKETGSGPDSDSPRTGSPQHVNPSGPTLQQILPCSVETKETVTHSTPMLASVVILTSPPNTPEKPISHTTSKCTMADKSTKTDDAFINGDLESCPTTTNAATMTVAVSTEAPTKPVHTAVNNGNTRTTLQSNKQDNRSETIKQPSSPPPISELSSNPPRMSYAQVAQNHKELRQQKERHSKDKQVPEQVTSPNNKQGASVNNNNNSPSATGRVPNDRDSRDSKDGNHQRDGSGQSRHGQSRNGPKLGYDRSGGQRRRSDQRTSQLRDFVPSRSSK